jgi:hypothetical protein
MRLIQSRRIESKEKKAEANKKRKPNPSNSRPHPKVTDLSAEDTKPSVFIAKAANLINQSINGYLQFSKLNWKRLSGAGPMR